MLITRAITALKAWVAKGFSFAGGSQLWGWVREPFAGGWQNNVQPEPVSNLAAFGAFYACVARIANDIGKLGLGVLDRSEDGVWRQASPQSPFWGPLRRPNSYQNRIQFITYWVVCKLLYGNAYALILRDARGIPREFHLIDPRRVTPFITPEGDVYYSLGGSDLAKIPQGMVVPAREMIHDRGPALWHPLIGVSPVYACGLSATQGLRIQANSATFFQNMSRPSGILTAPSHIDDETAARLKSEWQANFTDGKLGRLAVLGDGLKYEAMTIAANDAQLIEQLRWTVEDVARAFAMPLYKIGAGPVPTAGNVEALHQQYYADTLQTHIEAIELCMTEAFAMPPDQTVEFDLDGLLRTDQLTQVDMLAKAVGGAIMAPNEARARRNLPPITGGDSVYLQQQNFSLEALAKRDAQADPFAAGKAPAPAPAPPEDPSPDDVRQFCAEFIKSFEVA